MADEADIANDKAQAHLDGLLSEARYQFGKVKTHYTDCNYCGDPTEGGARFCCKDCRDDYDRIKSAEQRCGIR